MRLALFAFGHVDGGAGQPDDVAALIAQRLDMQIVPADVSGLFDRHFGPLRRAARQRLAFKRDNRRDRIRRQNVLIGAAENIVDRMPEHGMADRGVAQIAVLRVDDDLGAMQRGFVAGKAGAQEFQFQFLRVDLPFEPAVFLAQADLVPMHLSPDRPAP